MTSAASSSSSAIKKQSIFNSQTRQLARTVLENCEMERKNNFYEYSIRQSLNRAAFYTGISKRTLCRIKKEPKESVEKFKPSKKRKKTGLKFCLDEFDRTVVHNTITEFYLEKKIVPTCPKLLVALREKIDFPWGLRTLQRLLIKMGYEWRRCQKKGTVLIEKPDIIFKRYHYLKKMRKYRKEKRNIFYVDETWVDSNLRFRKCWQMIGSKGILTDTSSGNKLVIINARGKNGFLPGASLIFKSGSSTAGDYHGQMNSTKFEKWVVEKLLPSLPERSVVVMDNAPYHSVQINKPPNKYSLKSEMIKWLEDNNLPCDRSMRKPDLFKIIEHVPVDINYKIDNIIREHGHEVLRLPPYVCDLNPIDLNWAAINRFVKKHNSNSDLCMTKLKEVTINAISTVTVETWEKLEEHVQKLENEYWQNDKRMECEMEDFNIEVGETSDEDDYMSICSDISSFDSDCNE